ncbi:hypothetical protein LINGRAHAP2_LOCUS20663, partial [Linum grandiflorum]
MHPRSFVTSSPENASEFSVWEFWGVSGHVEHRVTFESSLPESGFDSPEFSPELRLKKVTEL